MKSTSSFLLAACLTASAPICAQTAPDPTAPPSRSPASNISPAPPLLPIDDLAAQGRSSNRSSRVEGIDYATDGSIRSVYLRDGAFVHLSSELGQEAGEFLHKGAKLTATGDAQTFAGQTIVEANSITLAGRTFIAPHPPAALQMAARTPPPMPGARAPRTGVEPGPGGPALIAPPLPRGPQLGGLAVPPPTPPPDTARLSGDRNVRPGAPQPGSPVSLPPVPAVNATPRSGVAPLPSTNPNAPTPQP